MASENGVSWLDETKIFSAMSRSRETDASLVREVLAKALLLKGLSASDVIVLSSIRTPDLTEELFETARKVKEEIYGNRLVLFAPLYVSNLCRNECLYCAFRLSNKEVKRRALNQEEIAQETRILIKEGHKRLLVVAGEAYPQEGLKYVIKTIETIYGIKEGQGEIRRVNANIAPLSLPEFKELKSAGIGTYQLFQETYHRETYRAVHVGGVKTDFNWRVTAMDRAMEADIDDVGVEFLLDAGSALRHAHRVIIEKLRGKGALLLAREKAFFLVVFLVGVVERVDEFRDRIGRPEPAGEQAESRV